MAMCSSCPAAIDWALLPSGKRVPVDHDSAGNPRGTLAVQRLADGTLIARVLKGAEEPGPSEKRGTSHFATCPNAAQHRKDRRG